MTFVVDTLALGQVFYLSTLVFPCQYHSTNSPYSSSSTRCSYQKDKWDKPGNLQTKHAFLHMRRALNRTVILYCSFNFSADRTVLTAARCQLLSLQIYIKGPALAIGYLNRPELNAMRFITLPEHGRMYRTGDWGYVVSDGSLEICGRCDSMVKIRGYSIEIQVCWILIVTCLGCDIKMGANILEVCAASIFRVEIK